MNPGGDYIICLLTVTDMPLSKVINAPVHPHICEYTHLCERGALPQVEDESARVMFDLNHFAVLFKPV